MINKKVIFLEIQARIPCKDRISQEDYQFIRKKISDVAGFFPSMCHSYLSARPAVVGQLGFWYITDVDGSVGSVAVSVRSCTPSGSR